MAHARPASSMRSMLRRTSSTSSSWHTSRSECEGIRIVRDRPAVLDKRVLDDVMINVWSRHLKNPVWMNSGELNLSPALPVQAMLGGRSRGEGKSVKGHRVIEPPSGGGNRGWRCDRRARCCDDSPTGRGGRRRTNRHPDSRGSSPWKGLQDLLQYHLHSPHTSPAPTPRHCHACRRAPRGWAAVAPPGASALPHYHHTMHSARVDSPHRQSSSGSSSRHAPRTPTPLLWAGGTLSHFPD
jgi:hypothetical protein